MSETAIKTSFFKEKWKKFIFIIAIVGPGIITANSGNDAGGIATYSMAGAHFGYKIIWILIPMIIASIIIQEMVARMGVVSGKGLSDLIRESYGAKVTFYLLLGLFLNNLGNVISEFAGIASSLEIFGIKKYISVPLSALAVWLLIAKGKPKLIERIFMTACVIYFAYIISGILAKPDWNEVAINLVKPTIELDIPFISMIIGLVGTTIAPWMQFYLQASIVEKNIKIEKYKYCRLDVIVGVIAASLVVFFIILACTATLYKNGININSASDAALALEPLAGKFASILFAFGLFNASIFAASILPLATSYYICEGLGLESGLGKSFKEAPWFKGIYTFLIITGAAFILIPELPLMKIMYLSQVVNGIVLAPVLIFIIKLVNKRWLMGEYVNGPIYNFFAWITVIIMSGLTVMLAILTFFPNLI